MSGWLLVLVFALVLFAGWSYASGARAERAAREWEERAANAQDFAEAQRQRADSTMVLAEEFKRLADSITVVTVTQVDTLRVEVERARLVEAPDTCAPFLAVRDSIIDRFDGAVRSWRMAYDLEVKARVEVQATATSLEAGLDSAMAVIAARPKPRSRWSPRLAAVAGVWDDRSYDAGLELTIGHVEVLGGLCDGRRCVRVGGRYPLF